MKATYKGLMTQRITVECQQIIAGSTAKLKVKTNTTTGKWVEEGENDELPLGTALEGTYD